MAIGSVQGFKWKNILNVKDSVEINTWKIGKVG